MIRNRIQHVIFPKKLFLVIQGELNELHKIPHTPPSEGNIPLNNNSEISNQNIKIHNVIK
jgi:hypothetical protein